MNWTSCLEESLDRSARWMGPALVILALGIISFCTFVFFTLILPTYNQTITKLGIGTLGMFMLFNSIFNYWKAVRTSPGVPPLGIDTVEDATPHFASGLGNRLRNYERVSSGDPGHFKICKKCDRIRPPRTHHCSVCQHCILRYDHHCPWIYNCVGEGNYRFFYLFLLWTALVDIFFILVAYSRFLVVLNASTGTSIEDSLISPRDRGMVIMAFVVAAAVALGLLAFLGFHTYLILTNQTTMEWATSGGENDEDLRKTGRFRRNPYDLGRRRNWKQILGESSFWYFSWLRSSINEQMHIYT